MTQTQSDKSADVSAMIAEKLLSRTGPLEVSPLRRREVWKRINATRTPFFAKIPRFAPALLLLSAGAVAAVHQMAPETSIPEQAPQGNAPPTRSFEPILDTPARTSDQTAEPDTAPPAQITPAPTREEDPSKKTKVATLSRTSPSSTPEGAEAELLWQAMQARQSGDVDKVRRLTEEYRKKHPGGELGEEALALSLEAAILRKDPKAAALAQEYLRRFPQGRFAGQARNALKK